MMVTVEKLNELMENNFLSLELSKINWSNLTDKDKEVSIRKASSEINKYETQYRGEKLTDEQEDSFPRILDDGTIIDVNSDIQMAILYIVYNSLLNVFDKRTELISSGVTSISVEGLSEHYKKEGVIKHNHMEYLHKYIYRGV